MPLRGGRQGTEVICTGLNQQAGGIYSSQRILSPDEQPSRQPVLSAQHSSSPAPLPAVGSGLRKLELGPCGCLKHWELGVGRGLVGLGPGGVLGWVHMVEGSAPSHPHPTPCPQFPVWQTTSSEPLLLAAGVSSIQAGCHQHPLLCRPPELAGCGAGPTWQESSVAPPPPWSAAARRHCLELCACPPCWELGAGKGGVDPSHCMSPPFPLFWLRDRAVQQGCSVPPPPCLSSQAGDIDYSGARL